MRENGYRHVPAEIGKFAFENFDSHDSWRRAAQPELKRILGLARMEEAEPVPLTAEILWKRENEFGSIEKIRIRVEEGETACLYFCIPHRRVHRATFICLQGHSTGMHTSLNIAWEDETTPVTDDGDRDFCIECMRRGIIAVAFEQRYMGERSSRPDHAPSCGGGMNGGAGATQALLVGRTAIGERVYDVERLIRYLHTRPEVEKGEIGIMGNSGGGTTAMFAGAVLPGLKYVMPSCAFSSFRASIGSMFHCECNYIPGLLEFGESADVLGLAASCPLVVVNGASDTSFPLPDAQKQFRRLERIYTAAGAGGFCRHVVGSGGHRFYAAAAWAEMEKFLNG
ncbi:MAG TPA: hypothetical protein K8W19_08385 [Victivallis vadensis]|nr:hypothetical protein [Victivallis vadensis]